MRTLHTPGVTFQWRDAAPPVIGPLRTDVAGMVGITERGPLHVAVKIESRTQFVSVFGVEIAQGYLAYAIDGFFVNGGATCWVVRVADPDTAAVASLDIVNEFGVRLLGIKAGSPGTWGNAIDARWKYRARSPDPGGYEIVSLTLHYPGGADQQLIRNPVEVAGPSVLNDIQIASESLPASLVFPLITLEKPNRGTPSENLVPIFAGEARLSGGSDGLETLGLEHFSGEGAPAGSVWGLAALASISEVSLVAMPDAMPKPHIQPQVKPPTPYDCRNLVQAAPLPQAPQTPAEFPPAFSDGEISALQEALIRHCETMRYRVAVLDTKDDLLPEQAIFKRSEFAFTNHASIYYPWILVDDPLQAGGPPRSIPPSGSVAGIYARNDIKRGVQTPPANEIVEGALDVKFLLDHVVHGELNDAHVNVIRSFPGRGIRVFGARTVSDDSVWTYINVRRLVLMIEKAIEQNTQWTVFEPNNPRLRRELDRVIRAYLESLFRGGVLDGVTSDDAYFVKCDDALNPPEEQDAGRVICQIGVLPPYPAEFVVILIGKTRSAVEVLRESGAANG
jgi:phage tail sheath protein FI